MICLVFFVYSHGQGESYHRGRAPLFSNKRTLYEGYHTHKPGSFSWSFEFELPNIPDVATIRQSKHQWKEKEHFLSTDDYIPSHPMPPTFAMRKWGFGYRWHAFVEYVIRVDVKEAEGARMVLPASSRKAIMPIMVKEVATSESNTLSLPLSVQFTLPEQLTEKTKLSSPSSTYGPLQSQTCRQTIKTSRLQDWNRENGTSSSPQSLSNTLRDRAKSMLGSSSLPRYTFDITVSVPERLQLLKEGAIPILVHAEPVQDSQLTTIPAANYPDVRIDNLSLELGATTHIRFKSIFPGYQKTRYDIKLLDRHPVDHTIDMSISCGDIATMRRLTEEQKGTDVSNETAIDISKLPGLAPAIVSAKMGRSVEKPLAPTFTNYIISREYNLIWTLELGVAGEKVKVSSDDKLQVQVLPPEAKELESLMQDIDITTAEVENEEAGEEDSEADSVSAQSKGDSTKSLLKKFKNRKSKQQEAAEEAAAAEQSNSMTNEPTFQYQPGEALPTYQRNPTDFGYRHEIDEQPPRYEAE